MRGFSLVELMVTLAVLAMLVSVALPSFVELTRSNRVTHQANDALAMARYARSEAVRRAEDVVLNFTPSDSGWRASVVDSANHVLRRVDHPTSPVAISSGRIVFDALGRAADARISLTYGSITRHVCIVSSGRAHVVASEADCP